MSAVPFPEVRTAKPFSFVGPKRLQVEWGGARRLGAWLADLFSQRRVLVVSDAFLRHSGLLAPALADLEAAGFTVTLFAEVISDPPEALVEACCAAGRTAACDLVLGIGGGSSMDVAKLAALLIATPQVLPEIYGIGRARGSRLPLVQVPTTAGTGSEATDIAILTTPGDAKMGVVSPQLHADAVLLDGELTLGLPPAVTAATGIDAMVHAIEAYTTKHRKNALSDALAREALRLLDAHLVTACTHGSDALAREAMLLGAHLAGRAFANAPVAAVHALAYPLGARCHLPHGLANALMLLPVLRTNARVAAPLYAELGAVLLGPIAGDAEVGCRRFLDHLEGRMRASGVTLRLRDAGVPEALLPQLAHDAMAQQRLLVNNPVEIDEAAALALYHQAW